MFRLKIVPRSRLPTLFRNCHSQKIQTWGNRAQKIFAYGYAKQGVFCMRFPKKATFWFATRCKTVWAIPKDNASLSVVEDSYYRVVLPLVFQVHNFEVLHASAVQTAAGIVVFSAISGTGKSTVAHAWRLHGDSLWADDAVVLDIKDNQIQSIPLPFSLRLSPEAQNYFGNDSAFGPENLLPARKAPLASVIVLRRDNSLTRVVQTRRLPPAEAFAALLTHANCFSLSDPVRKRRMVKNFLEVTARVPIFETRFRTGLKSLPTILDNVNAALSQISIRGNRIGESVGKLP